MAEPAPVRHAARTREHDLARNLAHPPFSDRRFWWAQLMVAVVFLIHLGADLAHAHATTPVPEFVWALLLLLPVVYAGTTFGLVGSLGVALTGIATLASIELILPHSNIELWGALSVFVMVLVTAVVLGAGFEEMQTAAKAQAAAEAFAKSEERFRLAFDGNMAAMATADLEGHVLQANRAFCEMLGRAEEEIIGVSFMDYTHPDDLAISEAINRQIALGEVDQLRYHKRYLHKNGGIVFAEVSKSLSRDDNGAPAFEITSIRDVTEERTLAAELSHQALHDSLTGLPNRALFEDRLSRAHDRAVRQGTQSALLLMDLDDFKGVNETLGHHTGDQLIVALARRLEKVTRSSDTLARFAGDAFIYLAEGLAHAEEAQAVAERLLGVLAEPFVLAGTNVKQSASLGAVVCDPGENADCTELVQDVDTAMHEAKSQGKARTVLFQPEMRARTSNSFQLAQDLSNALERREIAMHYQPIVELANGNILGYEALMRWRHPERGLVPPDVFIPLAEQSDLIVALGAFALREAIAEAASWDSSGSGAIAPYVAVNLSARQFHDPKLIATIEELLTSGHLAPERLVLEITESIALSDIESAIRTIEHLQHLKVAVALDDFGTGYSSLSYLAILRPNIIKIDRSFVSSSHRSVFAGRLLAGIVSLCHVLEMTVLAEGIETHDQLELLRQLGCEFGQGFLFSPAVPADGVAEMGERVRSSLAAAVRRSV